MTDANRLITSWWRRVKHFWFTKILGWQSFEIRRQVSPAYKTTYLCYGYVASHEINITVNVASDEEAGKLDDVIRSYGLKRKEAAPEKF